MRNYPHRCRIVPYGNAGAGANGTGGIGGEHGLLRVWEDVPCQFAFMDAMQSEVLFGAQSSRGTLLLPHYVTIPEQVGLNTIRITDYYVVLSSPQHPLLNHKLPIDTIRWARPHLICQIEIPNVG